MTKLQADQILLILEHLQFLSENTLSNIETADTYKAQIGIGLIMEKLSQLKKLLLDASVLDT